MLVSEPYRMGRAISGPAHPRVSSRARMATLSHYEPPIEVVPLGGEPMPDGGNTADASRRADSVVMVLRASPAGRGVGESASDALIVRREVVMRLAAALFFGSGLLTFVAAAIAPAGRPRALMVGVVSVLIGVFTWLAPWGRWPSRASFCLAPVALVLIAAANVYGSHQPYDYAVFYVIVHAWVGLAHRPRSSLLLAPLTAVAYCDPLFTIAEDLGPALATALVVVPACALVGEGISWMMSRLESSEALGRRLSEALAREHLAVEQLRDAHAQLEFLAYHDAVRSFRTVRSSSSISRSCSRRPVARGRASWSGRSISTSSSSSTTCSDKPRVTSSCERWRRGFTRATG